jgi:hypothetical protein
LPGRRINADHPRETRDSAIIDRNEHTAIGFDGNSKRIAAAKLINNR